MEFLAESIGLLDIDESCRATVGSVPLQNDNTTTDESNNNVLSILNFSSWGEPSNERQESDSTVEVSNIEGLCTGASSDAINERKKIYAQKHMISSGNYTKSSDGRHSSFTKSSEGGSSFDQEEEGELEVSNVSLLSSLTPASPLTMSCSSLNLMSSTNLHSSSIEINERRLSSSGLDCIADDLDTAFQDGLNRSTPLNTPRNHNESILDVNVKEHTPLRICTAHAATKRRTSVDSDTLTKQVTQRIDARTNYDCFTGSVDAVTGNIIHGTMLYRQTGTVYEGPFITKYIHPERRKSIDNIISPIKTEEGDMTTTCDTIPLRHGLNAKCQWSNGVVFQGSWEYDHPKYGVYTGEDWSYEGPLLVVKKEDDHNLQTNETIPSSPPSENSETSNIARCIGFPIPLPGSVVFHGKGRFTRSDGLVYNGEFINGLANGVGKETLTKVGHVYTGEFQYGLRHGLGTLMEPYTSQSEEEESDGRLESSQNVDPGPDAAAGGTLSTTLSDQDSTGAIFGSVASSFTPTSSINEPEDTTEDIPQQSKMLVRTGVWCAGTFEIEDSRGTVCRKNNEFTEVNHDVTNTSTTWDNLDAKWLYNV